MFPVIKNRYSNINRKIIFFSRQVAVLFTPNRTHKWEKRNLYFIFIGWQNKKFPILEGE